LTFLALERVRLIRRASDELGCDPSDTDDPTGVVVTAAGNAGEIVQVLTIARGLGRLDS
jgi:hypothetical protein